VDTRGSPGQAVNTHLNWRGHSDRPLSPLTMQISGWLSPAASIGRTCIPLPF
jgi:hypothetical protein